MKLLHSVNLSIFIKPDEDRKQLKELFLSLIPFDMNENKIQLKESLALTLSDKNMFILELTLSKERHTNEFINFLNNNLSIGDKEQLFSQDNRLDNNCNFFFRFKKASLPKLVLTDDGDCVHCKLSIAAFPKKKVVARDLIKKIIK